MIQQLQSWHCLSEIRQIPDYSWDRIRLYHCASGLHPCGWLHFPRRHKAVLLWKIPWRRQGNPLSPWTEQPGRLQSIGLHGVGPSWSDSAQHVSITQIYCGALPQPVVRLCPHSVVTSRAVSPGISNPCSPQTHSTTEMHVAPRKITFRQLQHHAVPDPADEDVGHALSFVANLGDTALWREAFLCFPVPHPHSL